MKRITSLACALIGAMVLATPFAQAQDRQSKEQAKLSHREGSSWHFIVSAEDLIGSPVYDANSERAGEIEYLMIGMEDAGIRHVVISSGGFLDIGDELRAVPWSAFDTPVSRTAARLKVTKKELQNSETTDRERLGDLTQPAVIARSLEYWAPLIANDKSNGKKSPERSSKPKSEGGSAAAKDDRQQKDGAGVPHVLIGRGVITTLVPPQAQFSTELMGAEIRSADGKEIGEVDHLMIETSLGRVAYVLISRGGFLGIGGEWVAVPFEVLARSPASDALNLKIKAAALEKIKAIPKSERPRAVRRGDLEKLYSQYNVKPFWSNSAQKNTQKKN